MARPSGPSLRSIVSARGAFASASIAPEGGATLCSLGLPSSAGSERIPRNARRKFRDRVALHRSDPLRINRLCQPEQSKVERQIGHVKNLLVAAEYEASRKEQAVCRAILGDAIEVAKLGDRLAGRVDY